MIYYTVNKQTKEHRLYDYGDECSEYYDIIAADKNGWIEWGGGECPLPCGALCDILRGDGGVVSGRVAQSLRWGCGRVGYDITAYRPLLESHPTEWRGPQDGLPPVGTVCEVYISNREVWAEVRIKAHVDGLALFKNGTGGHYCGSSAEFCRPIRSEREKWIEAATEYFCDDSGVSTIKLIYDAILAGELSDPKDLA